MSEDFSVEGSPRVIGKKVKTFEKKTTFVQFISILNLRYNIVRGKIPAKLSQNALSVLINKVRY